MKNTTQILRLFLLLVPFGLAAQPDLPQYSKAYDPARDPFSDSIAALSLARKTHRRVLIEVGGNWCSWCHILDRFINSNRAVAEALHGNFVLLKINVSDENSNEEFMASFPKPLGYPHFYVSDASGSILHSQDTAKLLDGKHYSVDKFLAFVERWKQK